MGVSCPDGDPDPKGQRVIKHMVTLLMKQNPQPCRMKNMSKAWKQRSKDRTDKLQYLESSTQVFV